MENQPPKTGHALVSKPSQEQLQQLLVALMGEGLLRYPNYPPTEVQQRLWLVDWLAMVRDYDLERFQKALRLAYRRSKFFPQPAEIEALIEPFEEVHKPSWKAPTEQELAESAEALKSPEALKFNELVKQFQDQKGKMAPSRPYIPSTSELAEELGNNPYLDLSKLFDKQAK